MAFIKYLLIASILALNIFGNESASAPITPYLEDLKNINFHLPIIEQELPSKPIDPKDVTFYLYRKDEPNLYYEIDPFHPSDKLKGPEKIVFIIHGWLENRLVSWYEDLKNAYLESQQDNYKVVQVDWHKLAIEAYSNSAHHTQDVGMFLIHNSTEFLINFGLLYGASKIVGQLIANMYRSLNIPVDQIIVVGHSLGGQTAGFVGKTVYQLTGKILPRIVALDPAGPLFVNRPLSYRLNPSDAEVVHVIHTNGGTFGYRDECGTIDFYPNGGNHQPGCAVITSIDLNTVPDLVVCNHQRSWTYFIEAMKDLSNFKSKRCENYLEFLAGVCDNVQVAMGDMKTTAKGNFYLETNSKPPYSKTQYSLLNEEHDSYKIAPKKMVTKTLSKMNLV